jgi:hypothetical protein
MTYLFKLSRRVARLRSAFALGAAVAAVAGCDSEKVLPSGPQKPALATVSAGART